MLCCWCEHFLAKIIFIFPCVLYFMAWFTLLVLLAALQTLCSIQKKQPKWSCAKPQLLQCWFVQFFCRYDLQYLASSHLLIFTAAADLQYIYWYEDEKKKKRPKAKSWTLIMSEHGSTPWLWVFSTFVREVNRFLNFCLTCLVKKSHFPCLW